jgi:hypothetical protein
MSTTCETTGTCSGPAARSAGITERLSFVWTMSAEAARITSRSARTPVT